MAVYTLKRVQHLRIPLEHAWDFFSLPRNLPEITPAYMRFRTTSAPDFLHSIYAGQIITYTVRPLLGIPLFWMTEITHVEPGRFFVDEQRAGPFAFWHHQHHFKETPDGVEMTDLVHFRLPLGFLGILAYRLFARRQLEAIFDFRRERLEQLLEKSVKS